MTKTRLFLLCMMSLSLFVGVATAQDTRTLNGTIDANTPFVDVAFVVGDNQTITLDMVATGGDLDPYIYLIAPDGTALTWNDDRERGDSNSRIVYPSATAGTYSAVATRYGVTEGETSGTFELTINTAPTTPPVEADYATTPDALTAAGFPSIEVRPQAQWTIIAYYGGDTNLEQGILHDLKEFENAGGSTENVRIVALFDRNPENFATDPDWSSSRLYEITATTDPNPDAISSVAITDLGVAQVTGDGQYFAQFLTWALTHFPAQRYAIAFGSHGAAWEGLIQDDTPNPEDAPATGSKDLLSLSELSKAFAIGQQVAGVEKFDLLVNDACSMSSIEYFSALQPYFVTSLASPEVVIDPALSMTTLTQLLNENPAEDVKVYARRLVDQYIDVDIRTKNSPDLVNLTHAVTDLTQFDALEAAVEDFARVFNANPRTYAAVVGAARHNAGTVVYSGFLGSTTKIDLGTFMQAIVQTAVSPQLRDAALNVLDALETVKVYARNGGNTALDNASYYNIYFPEDEGTFRPLYLENSPLTEWGRMLRNYYSANNPSLAAITGDTSQDFHAPFSPQINITSVYPPTGTPASISSPVTVDTEVVGRNLAYVETTTDQKQPDGTFIRLATERVLLDIPTENGVERLNLWSPGVDLRSVNWDVTLPKLYAVDDPSTITDATNGVFEYVSFVGDLAYLDGYYREPNSDTYHDVTVIFNGVDRASRELGRVLRVISRSPSSETAADIQISVGSEFIPFRQSVTADGVTTLLLSPNRLTWPEGGLVYQWSPAPNGEYTYGLLATAYGGTTGYNKTTIVVDNTTSTFDVRGETVPFGGFSLQRPIEWERLVYSIGDLEPYTLELYRSSAPDGREDISVYIISEFDNNFEPIPDDLTFIVNKLVEVGGLVLVGEPRAITVQGVPALEFDYTYESEAGTVTGRAFTVYNAPLASGNTFAAESLDGAGAALEARYAALRDTIRLFDAGVVLDARVRNWRFQYFNDVDNYTFLRPATWFAAEMPPNRYSENGDPASSAFFEWFTQPEDGASLSDLLLNTTSYTAELENFIITRTRSYANLAAWDVVQYTATRNGQAVQGRYYATSLNEVRVILHVEVPDTPEGAAIMTNTLEILVDTVILQ
jgi:hypothetical protein